MNDNTEPRRRKLLVEGDGIYRDERGNWMTRAGDRAVSCHALRDITVTDITAAPTGMPDDGALIEALVGVYLPGYGYFGISGAKTVVAAIRPLFPASAPEPTPGLVEAVLRVVDCDKYGLDPRDAIADMRAALNALPEDEWEETDYDGYAVASEERRDCRHQSTLENGERTSRYFVKRQPAPALPEEPQGDVLVVDTDGFIWTPESDSEGRFYTCCTANRDGLTWAQLAPRVTAVYTPSEPQGDDK